MAYVFRKISFFPVNGLHACIFRRNLATHSEARWPPVPIHCGRLFRSNLATLKGLIEAALDNRI
jgi:hypothetical protein